MDEDRENNQIPWDAFFWRNPIVRNITEHGVTRQELWTPPVHQGEAIPFLFQPDPDNFWQTKLKELLDRTNSVIFPVPGGMRVWGDGVRLFLPLMWLYDTEEDDLVLAIGVGINVSLQNREVLGY